MSEACCAISVIDLGDALEPGTAHAREVALNLGIACETVGVFHLANHGMSGETLHRQLHLAREAFHDLSAIADAAMTRLPYGDDASVGGPADRDHLRCIASVGSTWSRLTGVEPLSPSVARQSAPYIRGMCDLAQRLMQLIALSLDLGERHFEAKAASAIAELHMLRVAPDHAIAAPAGAAPNAGSSAITISVQDERGGLEIKLDGGRWIPIEPRTDMLLVSVGDALARWTKGHYRARMHRIQAQHDPRYVMPFQYRSARALRPLAA